MYIKPVVWGNIIMIWCLTRPGPVYLQSLYLGPINKWATPAQKEVFQEPYLHGDRVGCFALSEPGMCHVVYIKIYFSKKKLKYMNLSTK